MSRIRSFVVWFMLVLVPGGCSTYRTASAPGLDPAALEEGAPPAEEGQNARIRLKNGEEIKGRIEAISGESLTIADVRTEIPETGYDITDLDEETTARYSRETVVVPLGDIASIETRHGNGLLTVAFIVGLLGAVLGITALTCDGCYDMSVDMSMDSGHWE